MESLLKAIDLFLRQLEVLQEELSDVMAQKRTAMTELESDELTKVCQQEQTLITRLQRLLHERHKILEFAKRRQLPTESLWHLVQAVADDQREEMQQRIELAQERAVQLRHESWVHWIISHRSYNHYTELIDLIAHCGQQSPTYQEGDDKATAGGAILDTSI